MPRVIVYCQNEAVYALYTDDEKKGYERTLKTAIAHAFEIDSGTVEVWWEVLLRESNADPMCLDIVFSVSLWKALIPFWLWALQGNIIYQIQEELALTQNFKNNYAIWVKPQIGGKYQFVKVKKKE